MPRNMAAGGCVNVGCGVVVISPILGCVVKWRHKQTPEEMNSNVEMKMNMIKSILNVTVLVILINEVS